MTSYPYLKRNMFLLALSLSLALLSACGYTVVQPGHVGIQINMSGSDKGVQDLPLKTGRIFYNPVTETVFTYPTFVQTAKWTKDVSEGHPTNEEISFTTKDSMVVFADVSLSYSLVANKVPNFYVKFRNDDLDQFTHGFLRNVARDQFNETAGKYSIEQIMGDNEQFLKEVRDRVQKQVEDVGVKIEQFGLIGAPRPPANVVAAINSKIQATQLAMQIENEIKQSQAQAAKTVAESEGQAKSQIALAEGQARSGIVIAQGLAEANRLKSSSITPQLLEWERLAAQRESIGKWDGSLPSTVMGGNTPMILSVPTKQ